MTHDPSSQDIKELRVLVAEENPVTQRVLSNMILTCGHTPAIYADTPKAVLDTLSNERVDVALVDWNIASADNSALLKELGKARVFDTTPVMLIVPGMEDKHIALAGQYGANHFLPKPIPAHLLADKIAEAVFISSRADSAQDLPAGAPSAPDPLDKAIAASQQTPPLDQRSIRAQAKSFFIQGSKALAAQDYSTAVQAFTKALELKPYFPEACKGLGLSYCALGESSKARYYCNKAALIYARASLFENAIKLHAELTEAGIHPSNPFKTLAEAHKTKGNLAKALEYYEHGAALTPADPMIAYNLFLLYRKKMQDNKALTTLVRLLEASRHVTQRRNLVWCERAFYKLTGQEWNPESIVDPGTRSRTGQASPHAAGAQWGSPTILVVDDEAHIRTLLARSLESLEDDGATLLYASDGEEGLDMIRDNSPDLVFLDVMMPRLNGFDLCRKVKHELNLADVYIIMLTAKGQEFDRKRGLEAGADVYMTKPFRLKELANFARAVLDM